MPLVTLRRLALLVSVCLALLLGSAHTASATTDPVELTRIGRPAWKPVDCHIFSGRIGDPPSGDTLAETIGLLLPEPKHRPHPDLGVGPGDAHRPPYSSELGRGLDKTDLHEGRVFSRAEFSSGSAVIAGCMIIPRPGTRGSSPDFRSGRIIPNELFPIHAEGVAYRNHDVFDSALIDYDVPALDGALDPPFDVDGHSHFPFFVATNDAFGPPGADLRGFYRYDYTLIDSSGAGWRVQARFLVVR